MQRAVGAQLVDTLRAAVARQVGDGPFRELLRPGEELLLHQLQRGGQLPGPALIGIKLEHAPLAGRVGQQGMIGINGAQGGEFRWDQHPALLLTDHLVRIVGKIDLGAAGQVALAAGVPMVVAVIGEPLHRPVDHAAGGGEQSQVIPQVLRGNGVPLLPVKLQEGAVGIRMIRIGTHINDHKQVLLVIKIKYQKFNI